MYKLNNLQLKIVKKKSRLIDFFFFKQKVFIFCVNLDQLGDRIELL